MCIFLMWNIEYYQAQALYTYTYVITLTGQTNIKFPNTNPNPNCEKCTMYSTVCNVNVHQNTSNILTGFETR